MSLRDDRRAQSIQIGAVLLFGVLIILLATYQAFVVPNQNREVEGNHVATITQQMQEVRNAIVSMPGSGGGQSITLTLGVEYPSRVIALNPPSPTGTVRTLGTTDGGVNTTVANAVATDGEVDDYWTGTNRSVNSGGIAYRPGYHEYQNPPTIVYENSLLYHQFDSGNLTRAGQRLIDGRRISLVAVNGSLNRAASGSVAMDLQDVSSSSRRISVTNEPGQNVTLDIATRFNRSQWETELAATGDYEDPDGYVAKVTQSEIPDSEFDVVHLHLERDETYALQMAKVGVGTGVAGTTPKYITAATSQNVEPGESFTAEVRDGLNNPVSGVPVQPDGCGLQTKMSDANGQATFACSQSGTVELQIKDGNEDNETVTFGSGASPDDQAPVIDEQATAATSEEQGYWSLSFDAEYAYQIIQDYSATDGQSGLDSVNIQLYDETDTLVTESSRTLNGTSSHEGRWISPWLNVDESDIQDYEVRVEAVDKAGNVATCIAGVGEGSCQSSQSSTTMADSVSLSGDGSTVGGSGQSRISFDLENDAQSEATITHLTLDSVSVSGTDDDDVYVDDSDTFSGSGTSYYQSRINQDNQVQLTTQPIIDGRDVETFNLGQFRTGPGNGNRVNMGGETVEITFQFSDGSEGSYTIEVT